MAGNRHKKGGSKRKSAPKKKDNDTRSGEGSARVLKLREQFNARINEKAKSCGFHIEEDPIKGRVCVSDKFFPAGAIIFCEEAYLFASEQDPWCLVCWQSTHSTARCDKAAALISPHIQLSTFTRTRWEQLEQSLAELDKIGSLDRARAFLQLLLRRRFRSDTSRSICDSVLALSVSHASRCRRSAVRARAVVPRWLWGEDLSVDEAAQLLGALNANSHELEQASGSAVFLLACMMEHSCQPNCSFTTFGSTLAMVALVDVGPGQPLAIDYGNNFYRPLAERRQDLHETYGFDCRCQQCSRGVDRCRVFHCPVDGCEGIVCPQGGRESGGYCATDRATGDSMDEELLQGHCQSHDKERQATNSLQAIARPPSSQRSEGSHTTKESSEDDAELINVWRCLSCGHECTAQEVRRMEESEEAFVALLEAEEDEEDFVSGDEIAVDEGDLSSEELEEGATEGEEEEEDDEKQSSRSGLADSVYKNDSSTVTADGPTPVAVGPLRELDRLVLRAYPLHREHHLVYWSLQDMAAAAAQDSALTAERVTEALYSRLLAATEAVLPRTHHQKVVLYDQWAQTRVLAGDVDGARELYRKALEMSERVSGQRSPPTEDVRALAAKTPRNALEMVEIYSRQRERASQLQQSLLDQGEERWGTERLVVWGSAGSRDAMEY